MQRQGPHQLSERSSAEKIFRPHQAFLRKEYLLPSVTEIGGKDILHGANNPAKDAEPDRTVLAAVNNPLWISLCLQPSQVSSRELRRTTSTYRDPDSYSDGSFDSDDSKGEYSLHAEGICDGGSRARHDEYFPSK